MCHHRTTESTRLYEDEHEELPEWATEAEDDAEADDEESEPEPFVPGTAD